jgi:hypothetical protein
MLQHTVGLVQQLDLRKKLKVVLSYCRITILKVVDPTNPPFAPIQGAVCV